VKTVREYVKIRFCLRFSIIFINICCINCFKGGIIKVPTRPVIYGFGKKIFLEKSLKFF